VSPPTIPDPHRFAITYPVERDGAVFDHELPFRIGIIADLAGDPALRPGEPARQFIPLGPGGVEAALAALQPRLSLRLGGAADAPSVILAFGSIADFDPPAIARQIAATGVPPLPRHIDAVRGHESFIRLEEAWRGLDLVAARAGSDPTVEVCILPATRSDLLAALDLSTDGAPGWLHRQVNGDVFGCLGASPFGLLVSDQCWTAATADIAALAQMAALAAPAFAPFVAMAGDSLRDVAVNAFGGATQDPAMTAWQALRDSDAGRHLVLTTPRPPGEPPGPFLLAAQLVDAFRGRGVCAEIGGSEHASGQPESYLARCGLLPIIPWMRCAPPVLLGGMTVHRPRRYDRPEASANAAIGAFLPHVLVTGRIAQFLKAMMRDRIGASPEPGMIEPWLQRWLAGLVAPPSAKERSGHPLYSARLELRPVPGEDGVLDAVCYLRPWLAAAELTTELRMIVRLSPPG